MFEPFSTTGIGSLPHLSAEDACRLVLETFDIPFWPQLPKVSFLEGMVPQYSEGMPFANIDTKRENIFVSRDESDELERFYETCTDGCRIAVSEDHAQGLHTFLKMIRNKQFKSIKGHITGPLTYTLGLKDRQGRLVYFDEELRQISLMLLQAKARWQINQLRPYAEKVIIFIDEPILSAIGGSSYLGVSMEETQRLLTETASAITEAGGIPGIHCCGNADWPMIIESGVRIINFDAYGYFENLAMYHENINEFLRKGNFLAWGIIPTTEAINAETPESIIDNFSNKLDALSLHIPKELLVSQIILTPTCGTGSLNIQEAIKVFQLLMRLKEAFV